MALWKNAEFRSFAIEAHLFTGLFKRLFTDTLFVSGRQ